MWQAIASSSVKYATDTFCRPLLSKNALTLNISSSRAASHMDEKVPSFNDVMLKTLESSHTPESSDEEIVKDYPVIEKTFYNFIKYKLYGTMIFAEEQTETSVSKLTPSTSSSDQLAPTPQSISDYFSNLVFTNKVES